MRGALFSAFVAHALALSARRRPCLLRSPTLVRAAAASGRRPCHLRSPTRLRAAAVSDDNGAEAVVRAAAVAGLDRVQAFARAHCARLAGDTPQKPELAKGQECDVPFPGLRATPWHATEELGWVARLEEDWREARDELTAFLALLDEGGFVKPETALCPETGRFEKLVLCEDGSQSMKTATRVGRDHFARTLALLRASGAPLGPAPVSMNRQPPNSGLPPHSDNANFLLTGHLGLVVPDDGVCEFVMVDSEARRWREGHVLLADTSFVHATRNDCEADRVVLHFTVWHPDLAAAERGGIVRLHEALRAAGG